MMDSVLSWLTGPRSCPIWPCEAIIVTVSAAAGVVVGFFLGRRVRQTR